MNDSIDLSQRVESPTEDTTTRVRYGIRQNMITSTSGAYTQTGGYRDAATARRMLTEHPEWFEVNEHFGVPYIVRTTTVETRTVTQHVVAGA